VRLKNVNGHPVIIFLCCTESEHSSSLFDRKTNPALPNLYRFLVVCSVSCDTMCAVSKAHQAFLERPLKTADVSRVIVSATRCVAGAAETIDYPIDH
jgi:hypothetical protein